MESSLFPAFKRGLSRGLGFGCGLLLCGALVALFAQSLNTFSAGDLVSSSMINENFANMKDTIQQNQTDLSNQITTTSDTLTAEITEAVPDGAIMAFALGSCPTGWIAADGTAGTPDLRGQFLRGTNNFSSAAGTRGDGHQDPAGTRPVGGHQPDQLREHSHEHLMVAHDFGSSSMGSYARGYTEGPYYWFNTKKTGGDETRPRNVAVLYCVRSNL